MLFSTFKYPDKEECFSITVLINECREQFAILKKHKSKLTAHSFYQFTFTNNYSYIKGQVVHFSINAIAHNIKYLNSLGIANTVKNHTQGISYKIILHDFFKHS